MKKKERKEERVGEEETGTEMTQSEAVRDLGKGSPMLHHQGLSYVLSFFSLRNPLRYSYLNNYVIDVKSEDCIAIENLITI